MERIADYLKLFDSPSTVRVYTAALYTFIDFIYGKQRSGVAVTDSERKQYEKLIARYFKEKRNFPDDITRFVVSLQSRPPVSARSIFSVVKEFFHHYDRELPAKELRFIRNKLPKGNARTVEKDLDIETIRIILQHLDVKGRALILVLASSGMRINEALSVTLDDVDLKGKPAVVTVRGETAKTGDTRITFISDEAKQAVVEWLKVREDYRRSSANRNNGLVKNGQANQRTGDDDGRLFPFSDQNASKMWENALVKAGLLSRDKSTNRKQLHYHQFRKFFISQLSLKVSKEIAETLAGHNGYLTDAYRRYTKKQLATEYLRGQHLLTIQTPKELQEMETELKDEIHENSEMIKHVLRENMRLKEQIEKRDTKDAETAAAIAEMQQTIRWLVEKTLPTDGKMRQIVQYEDGTRKLEIPRKRS